MIKYLKFSFIALLALFIFGCSHHKEKIKTFDDFVSEVSEKRPTYDAKGFKSFFDEISLSYDTLTVVGFTQDFKMQDDMRTCFESMILTINQNVFYGETKLYFDKFKNSCHLTVSDLNYNFYITGASKIADTMLFSTSENGLYVTIKGRTAIIQTTENIFRIIDLSV